jgi:hypothetical protein
MPRKSVADKRQEEAEKQGLRHFEVLFSDQKDNINYNGDRYISTSTAQDSMTVHTAGVTLPSTGASFSDLKNAAFSMMGNRMGFEHVKPPDYTLMPMSIAKIDTKKRANLKRKYPTANKLLDKVQADFDIYALDINNKPFPFAIVRSSVDTAVASSGSRPDDVFTTSTKVMATRLANGWIDITDLRHIPSELKNYEVRHNLSRTDITAAAEDLVGLLAHFVKHEMRADGIEDNNARAFEER